MGSDLGLLGGGWRLLRGGELESKAYLQIYCLVRLALDVEPDVLGVSLDSLCFWEQVNEHKGVEWLQTPQAPKLDLLHVAFRVLDES